MSRRSRFWTIAAAVTFALTLFARADAGAVRLPSRFVPGDTAVAPAVNDQTAPSLCQGGTRILAMWSDNRANSTGGHEGETSWDIYGMRFDAAGHPLETVPFAIAAGVELERSAIEFYRAQARTCPDERARATFHFLADWEKGHLESLSELERTMRDSYFAECGFSPM